jgi:SRSO17 transposase
MVEPRSAVKTVTFVDNYCAAYRDIFPEVRSFEGFKFLHLGMISEIPRKTLPAIARAVGLTNDQVLHHFLSESPWKVEALKQQRLSLILQWLRGRPIILVIDETGDKKKGKTTDYVDRQYIGNLGKVENGIVSVNAYGVLDGLTFPLIFKIFKPHKRLKQQDTYKTKPQLAREIIEELIEIGFKFELVLADSVYGESETFIGILNRFKLKFVVAIRSNHSVLMGPGQRLRCTRWQKFNRWFSNGQSQLRYIREIIFGKRHTIRYWQITTDKDKLPENSTWFIMSNLPGAINKTVGNDYGLRTWVEYGFKHAKNHLGWADFRLTRYEQIERWWEVVCSAYLMVSLQFNHLNSASRQDAGQQQLELLDKFATHPWWSHDNGWKHKLNNLQLIIQPYIYYCLIKPWIKVFENWHLRVGFSWLTTIMNEFIGYVPASEKQNASYFSSV